MNTWYDKFTSPTHESLRQMHANKLADGRVELIVTESVKKTLGSKWNSRTAVIVLRPEDVRELVAYVEAAP